MNKFSFSFIVLVFLGSRRFSFYVGYAKVQCLATGNGR